ncbi:TetR family transcriptional regulator [Streptomyces griseocarneus]|nr:TetR family transcriptional regulator [Streptomyces griseocarneus]
MTTGRGHAARPPRRTDARLNRERLMAAAQEVFTEAGPGASLNEIARRAGVGPGTLYRHFPNRQALLTAVLRDRVQALCEQAQNLHTSDSPDGALSRWLGAFLAHARAHHGMGSALMVNEPGTSGLDCHQLIVNATAHLLAQAQQHGTARADVTAGDLVQLVTGIALSTAHDKDAEPARRLLALVLDAAHAAPRRSA